MGYTFMYILFGIFFVFGVVAYWLVTRSFRDENFTYEQIAEEKK